MLRTILTYGLTGGLIVGIPLSLIVITGFSPHGWLGMALGYLIMLIALSTVFVAIKRRRDEDLGGVIRFLPALGLGLAISIVASVIYVISWDLALLITNTDFGAEYTKPMIAKMQASGAPPAEIAQFTAEMEQFAADYRNPLIRWPMTFLEIFPVGVLVSVVSAGLLCNRRFLPARPIGTAAA